MKKQFLYLMVLLAALAPAAVHATAYDDGLRLYQQGNFKGAAAKFDQAVKANPNDSNAYYYRALSNQYLGNPKARSYYQEVITKFPNSQAAGYARQALVPTSPTNLAPRASRRSAPSASGSEQDGGGSDLAGLPDQSRVYFTQSGKSLVIEAELEGRRIPMIFDTGAEGCVFGKNHLQQLGINPPTGDATGQAAGVGSGGLQKTWTMKSNIKVGQIQRNNFPVIVQENLGEKPLLGQSFFKDFEYTIDYGAQSIVFHKRGANPQPSGGSDNYSVPFIREGNELVVNVEVDGRRCPMYFDTGADSIAFTKEQVKALGITIPEDAEEEIHSGVAGATAARSFNVRRMRLGPIDKTDIRISVLDQSAMAKPLLGQTFYGGWQYTIDNKRNVIRFVRR